MLIQGLILQLVILKVFNRKLISHLFRFYRVQHSKDRLKAYLLKELWGCQLQEVIVDHIS
jgi:hypothetical protein